MSSFTDPVTDQLTDPSPLGFAMVGNRMLGPPARQASQASDPPGLESACVRLAGGQGITIVGNRMDSAPVAIDFAGGSPGSVVRSALVSGNDLQGSVTGTNRVLACARRGRGALASIEELVEGGGVHR
jgi:hypothetical protein